MARRSRRTSSPTAAATWRDGVHLTGTPIWCDARRRRDVCFVSSADRLAGTRAAGHGQLIGTPIALALVGGGGAAGHLAVPLRKPFTLGTLRLELIASGRTLGAAALHVTGGARSVLYAGAIRAGEADVRASDAVVVGAPLGEAHHVLRPVEEVAAAVVDWTRGRLAAGKRPVLVVDHAGDGLEIAAHLHAAGVTVAGSRLVREAALRVGELASVPPLRAPGREPAAIVRTAGERARDGDAATALVSVRALDETAGCDARFAYPFAADRARLLAWIDQTGAREVYVTGACAEAIAAAVGPRAKMLGPPRQMSLFGA